MALSKGQTEPIHLPCLNNDVICKILTSFHGEIKGTVDVICIERACSKSEGLTSDVFRVNLHIIDDDDSDPEAVSFIIKLNLNGSSQSSMDQTIFTNEKLFLSEVMVEMYHVLSSVGNLSSFTPKCYYNKSGEDFIALEDLVQSGYRLASKGKGLDLDHSLLVMRNIALFHATAAIVRETKGKLLDQFQTSKLLSLETLKILTPVLEECFEFAIYEAKMFPELKDNFHHTILQIIDSVVEVSKARPNGFNVLLHGDLWINNMMFKYNQEKVKSVKFIDFQMIYTSSPAVDLTFCLYSSVADDVISEHLDLLILEYHRHLQNLLSLLNYSGVTYTLSDLKREMDEKYHIALLMTMSLFPIALSCSEGDYDLASVLSKTQKGFSKVLYNPHYIVALRRRLPIFAKRQII